MPRCMHTTHSKTYIDNMVYGWDGTKKHWQICDEGFVATRGENRRVWSQFNKISEKEWKASPEIRYTSDPRVKAPKKSTEDAGLSPSRISRRPGKSKGRVQSPRVSKPS